MNAVYNPEADLIERIERLELEARDLRRKIDHAHGEKDRRFLNKLLKEVQEEVALLQSRVP